MNDLININNDNGRLTASSREVAGIFEKQHAHVIRDIEVLINQNPNLDADYFIETSYKAGTGKLYKEYLLIRDGFSLLAMGFTGVKALEWKLKYLEAFNKMEETIKSGSVPEGKYLLALAVLESNKIIEDQELVIKELTPKGIFADSVSASFGTILVGEMAKILKQNGVDTGEKRFYAWLRDNGYLIKRKGADYNKPTQRSMELGLFVIKETAVAHSSGFVSLSITPKITGKGQIYFVNKLKPALALAASE
ncbi:phage regulatory protein/antirepressor Ant [Acetobacterium tundrae]|uniref:Phage regulatory protein/antirepressor Ant n=1 Tax=Acetobacterium tundrae TaxID=132932 RepID=A0ABR6WPT9_9FIRM|nr:phage regulatory protein/antirepressor Ant [Acetobacterium tundrae]MBC3798466.1 phage regulatory protein/antirepressor Ant [Acetobacterium tundrae]